jgi:hypothetical protein
MPFPLDPNAAAIAAEAQRIIRLCRALRIDEPDPLARARLTQLGEYAELIHDIAVGGGQRPPIFSGSLSDYEP